ncbi:hypothetical protein FIBSPDRAFT_884383 [Athelia psychrophila]|uniref:Uncharacterized protein n=1 Tax=Athelia psychrophila TaxID=1759441 RepID=A0A166T222_9AGAM|nr:hypothetical protein FIBSPDRAFT_884383 [Fibularhizoctonia sp. CBS 109695]
MQMMILPLSESLNIEARVTGDGQRQGILRHRVTLESLIHNRQSDHLSSLVSSPFLANGRRVLEKIWVSAIWGSVTARKNPTKPPRTHALKVVLEKDSVVSVNSTRWPWNALAPAQTGVSSKSLAVLAPTSQQHCSTPPTAAIATLYVQFRPQGTLLPVTEHVVEMVQYSATPIRAAVRCHGPHLEDLARFLAEFARYMQPGIKLEALALFMAFS